MGYRELMRRKMLEQIYDKMSDEEKRTYIQLTMQDKDHREIMNTLQQQQMQLEELKKGQNWKVDFLSDIGANVLTDTLWIVGRKLFGKL